VHRRERVSKHLRTGDNLGLISVRQVAEGVFSHALVCRSLVESRITISNKGIGFVLPLWLEPEWPETGRRPNLSATVLRQLETATDLLLTPYSDRASRGDRGDLATTFGSRDVFDFVYAQLHSAEYRLRYADFLKSDFPRVAVTPPKALFGALVRIGTELVALHLLESRKLDRPITEYLGGRAPEVERVSWSKNSVWLDKAQTIGFKGVREEVWHFHIGGYQVCEKWLKDRKGRRLSKDDIVHYQKIIVALAETISLMKEIDEVIEAHGGWPGAFQTDEAKAGGRS
jgi:predicted helicase